MMAKKMLECVLCCCLSEVNLVTKAKTHTVQRQGWNAQNSLFRIERNEGKKKNQRPKMRTKTRPADGDNEINIIILALLLAISCYFKLICIYCRVSKFGSRAKSKTFFGGQQECDMHSFFDVWGSPIFQDDILEASPISLSPCASLFFHSVCGNCWHFR